MRLSGWEQQALDSIADGLGVLRRHFTSQVGSAPLPTARDSDTRR